MPGILSKKQWMVLNFMANALLLPCVLIPFCGAFALPFVGRASARARNVLALVLVAVSLACSAALLPGVLRGQGPSVRVALPMGLSMGLAADALAVFMALTSAAVGCVILVYAWDYMAEYDNLNEFYFVVVLFLGAMMGLVYSTNLILMYGCWEISSVCCWRLIGFYRDDTSVLRGEKAYLITVLGALIMLIGFVGIYAQTGTFEFAALRGVRLPDWIVWTILAGILSKSATFPLDSWLPDAGVAPSPVTSLLHAAVLVKIGVYAYARLFALTFVIDPKFTVIVPTIAAVSAIVSAGAALRANDLKRVIAFSTVSQLAFILLGVSTGSAVALEGGLLYIMAHSVGKGGLFLCAGIVEHRLHTKDLSKMGGLIKTMPLTAAAFLLCAFSIMGLPPFGGFFAKFLVIDGIFAAGQWQLGLVFLAGAVLTVMYLTRLFVKVFLGPPVCGPDAVEGSPRMVGAVLTLGVVSLLMGVFVFVPSALALLAV
jgi:NADH:ubiquinone oxidoreductase subunit 5 (subunit L)/multisubunit Na+/H+ antiporter MnhA subunit